MEYTSRISFPGLGIKEFSVKNVAFTIPGTDIAIMWYALLITFGMICCIAYVITQAKKIGIVMDDIIDYALFVIPIGVIGARLYYVAFDNTHIYESIVDVFNIRDGGLAIYGGIIAGALTVLAVSLVKKIKFFAIGDCAAPGVLLAQGIGRWGNFMNGEAYGSQTNGIFRMGLSNGNINWDIMDGKILDVGYNQMAYVHPTFLYESVWNLLGVLLVYLYSKLIGKKYDGQLILLTFGWYGLGRFFIEGLRTDSLYVGDTNIRVSQALAAIIFVVCIGLLIFFMIKKPTAPLYHKAPAEGEAEKATSEKKTSPIVEKIMSIFAAKKSEEETNEHSSNVSEENNIEENDN